MRDHLQLGRGLRLPLDAVTQTFGWIGQKGSGKTYFAGKFVEELYAVGAPVVVIDPVGNWGRGLRLAADGKRAGLPIPVLGGIHGDVPLVASEGPAVARFVAAKGCAVVLDVSAFRTADMRTFVADFCEELFHLAKAHRRPTMVVFEEAQLFAPQHPSAREAHRLLDGVANIVRLGRNFGLGSTLITQRPQSVSKEVLNQVECLFVGKLNGRHERKAIDDWIVQNVASDGDVKDLVRQLPSLATGDMMLWSPTWLGVFKQVRASKKKTFDASATPKLGVKHRAATKLPTVDLGDLKSALADALAEARDNDPEYLRDEIARLEEELEKKSKAAPRAPIPEPVEVEVITEDMFEQLEGAIARATAASVGLQEAWAAASAELSAMRDALGEVEKLRATPSELKRPNNDKVEAVAAYVLAYPGRGFRAIEEGTGLSATTVRRSLRSLVLDERVLKEGRTSDARYFPVKTFFLNEQHELPPKVEAKTAARLSRPADTNGLLSPTELNLMRALKLHHPEPLTRTKMALVGQRSPRSSTVSNAITALVKKGYVERLPGRTLALTADGYGHPALARAIPLPTGEALVRYWMDRLAPCPAALLRSILQDWPDPCSRQRAVAGTDYSPTSSTVSNALTLLRKLELVKGPSRGMVANEALVGDRS